MKSWLQQLRSRSGAANLERLAAFFVVLVCASVFGVTAWRINVARDLALRDGQTDSANIARSLADHAHATVRMADILVAGLVERLENEGASAQALARLHQAMVEKIAAVPRVANLLVFAPDGEMMASSLPRLTAGAGDREYFAYHRTHPDREAHLAPPVQSLANGRWVLCVSRRFNQPDGTFGGVVLATVELDTFSAFYASFDIGANGSIVLLNEDSTLLVRVPAAPEGVNTSLAALLFFRAYNQQGPVGAAILNAPARHGFTWRSGLRCRGAVSSRSGSA